MDHTTAQPRDLFRAHGLRCTRQREHVFEVLRATAAHPTADELLQMVRVAEPGVSLATVYNTLEALTGAGLARRLPSHAGNGPCRYDADVSRHMHIRTEDGRVLDVPEDLAERLAPRLDDQIRAELESRLGVTITRAHLELFGRDTGG